MLAGSAAAAAAAHATLARENALEDAAAAREPPAAFPSSAAVRPGAEGGGLAAVGADGLDEGAADDGDHAPETPWAFAARGDLGVEEDVRLLYNGREKTAMDGAVLEMQRARTVLGLDPQAALSHEQAFMACLPPQLVEEMLQWLFAGEAFKVGAAEFVNYLRVECILRYSGAPIDFVERAGFANVTQLQAYRNISSRIRAIKCPVEAMESMQEAARMHWRGTFVHEETSDVDHDASDGLYIFASNATGFVLDATLTTSGSGLSTQVIVDTASRLGAATSSMTMAVQRENVELLQAARFSNRLLLGSSYDVSWLSVVPWSPKFPVQEAEVSPETPFKSDHLTMSRRGRRTCVVAKNEAMQIFASWVRHGDNAEGRVTRYETTKSDWGDQTWVLETAGSNMDASSPGCVKRDEHAGQVFVGTAAEDVCFHEMDLRIYKLTQRSLTQDWFLARLFRFTPAVVHFLAESEHDSWVGDDEVYDKLMLARAALGLANVSDHAGRATKKRRKEGLDGIERQTAFLQTVVPRWFSSSIDQECSGSELLPVLSLGSLSSVQIVSAQRYGLVVCRDQPSLATSPDGVVALRNGNETFLATLVVDASAPLGEDAGEGALDVIECECGTPSFREVVEDSGVRARLVHDATVLGVDYALLARASSYGEGQGVGASATSVAPDVSGLENRRLAWVLVRVPETQRAAWKGYFRELQVRFMRFTTEAEPRMPRVAQDGNAVYGNAVELRTVNLWLRLSKLYESDVLEHGTPPACKRLLPLVANVWNRSRSNMDTLLQCTRRHEPAEATVWERLLSLTFFNAFRLHELALSPDGSAALLYDDRIPATTRFRDFMLSLKNELHTEPFKRFFPLAGPASMKPKAVRRKTGKYNALRHANTDEQTVQHRLNGDPSHVQTVINNQKVKDGRRCARLTCVVCCASCEKGVAHKSRLGRKTRFQCFACKVALCPGSCWELWHSMREIPLPKCLSEG